MKDVYQMLNEVDVDTMEYDIPELTRFEKKRMKKRIKKKIQKRTTKSRSKLWAISAAALIILSLGIGMQPTALAKMPILGPLLEQYLGTDDGQTLESYKTILGQSIENEQGTITLNEVIIDEGRLLINSTFETRSDNVKLENVNPFPAIFINGEEVSGNGGGDVQQLGDSTYSLFSSMDVQALDLGKPLDIKIIYEGMVPSMWDKEEWTFEFTASGETLLAVSKTIPINQQFSLKNGQRVVVEELYLTPVSSTLKYRLYSNNDLDYEFDVRLLVEDEMGKIYEPQEELTLTRDAYFRFEVLEEDISKLKVTPFVISGKEGEEKTDYHEALNEEAFEVEIE